MFRQAGDAIVDAATFPLRYPFATAIGATVSTVANNLIGNPVGGAIDAVTGNAWNLKPDVDAIAAGNLNQMQSVGDAMYNQQVRDQMAFADKATLAQQSLQAQQIQAAQSSQLLNGYLQMIQDAQGRATAVSQTHY